MHALPFLGCIHDLRNADASIVPVQSPERDAPRDCGLDNFTSLSNRRLAALLMFQALHRDRCIKAWCKILVVSDNTESRSGGGNR